MCTDVSGVAFFGIENRYKGCWEQMRAGRMRGSRDPTASLCVATTDRLWCVRWRGEFNVTWTCRLRSRSFPALLRLWWSHPVVWLWILQAWQILPPSKESKRHMQKQTKQFSSVIIKGHWFIFLFFVFSCNFNKNSIWNHFCLDKQLTTRLQTGVMLHTSRFSLFLTFGFLQLKKLQNFKRCEVQKDSLP